MSTKIAVIGSHSTGKTSLANKLLDYLSAKGADVAFIPEIVRECPFPVNEDTTIQAQEWVLRTQINREKALENHSFIVCDRSVLDNYMYLFRRLLNDHSELHSTMIEHLSTYDYLFLTRICEEKIPEDGFRSTNSMFREDIEVALLEKVNELKPMFAKNNVKFHSITSFDEIKAVVKNLVNP
jgi:nicotinamide riboside kinase